MRRRSQEVKVKRLLLAILIASSAYAQRYGERVVVDLVEVPVNVTRHGQSVRGLTRNDFELYVNGKRHPVRYFDVLDEGARDAASPAAAGERALDRRRLTVLLFDTTVTGTRLLARAREAAFTFVHEAAPGETFAVARLTRDGVAFVVPFTSNHDLVRRAIATLAPSRAGDAFSLVTPARERANPSDLALSQSLDTTDAFLNADNSQFDTPEAAFQTMSMELERKVNEEHRRDDQNLVTVRLGDMAERLAAISGLKRVILIADGAAGGADRGSVTIMHRRFRAAGVILDAVELDANTVPTSFGPQIKVNTPRSRFMLPENDKTASLYALALETGGTVTKHADIADGLRSLRDMHRMTYVLGFTPPADQKDDNTISVRVPGQPFGTTVNHRPGYSTRPPGDRGDALFLADVLMNDIPQRGLTLDLRLDRDAKGATLRASVPGRELLSIGADRNAAMLDVIIYVFDEKGSAVGWGYSRLSLDLAKGRQFLESNPYTLRQRFELGSGKYSAKALLRVVGTDIAGFQRSDFEVAPVTR